MTQHKKCLLWKGLWLLAIVSLILGWIGVIWARVVFGVEPLAWFWTALILAVLSVPIKLDCHSCTVCMPEEK